MKLTVIVAVVAACIVCARAQGADSNNSSSPPGRKCIRTIHFNDQIKKITIYPSLENSQGTDQTTQQPKRKLTSISIKSIIPTEKYHP